MRWPQDRDHPPTPRLILTPVASAPVRLALLSMDYPPRMAGGTTIHTRALALALLEAGHEVHVVAARAEGAPDEEVREGVLVHRVGRPYTAWSGLRTGRLLKEVDVVHGHGTCAYGHLKLHEFPTVVKMHSTWHAETERYRELGSGSGSLMAMRTYTRMDRYCARRADHLICITDAVARETETAYAVPRDRIRLRGGQRRLGDVGGGSLPPKPATAPRVGGRRDPSETAGGRGPMASARRTSGDGPIENGVGSQRVCEGVGLRSLDLAARSPS